MPDLVYDVSTLTRPPGIWALGGSVHLAVDNSEERRQQLEPVWPLLEELYGRHIYPLLQARNEGHFHEVLRQSWEPMAALFSAFTQVSNAPRIADHAFYRSLRQTAAQFGGAWEEAARNAERWSGRLARIDLPEGREAETAEERQRLDRYIAHRRLFEVAALSLMEMAAGRVRPRNVVQRIVLDLLGNANRGAWREAYTQQLIWREGEESQFSGQTFDPRNTPILAFSQQQARKLAPDRPDLPHPLPKPDTPPTPN